MVAWRPILLVLCGLLVLVPAQAWADDRSAEPTPDQLVEQLGDARFIQRQIATEALTGIGLPALNAVRKGTEHTDPEVRFRSRQILRAIRHLERQRLISAFIAGLDVETANELPGWVEYKTLVGDEQEARSLYVQMLEAEWVFLDAIFQNDPTLSGAMLASRCRALRLSLPQRPISIGSIAALMFVAARDGVDLNNQGYLMTLCYRNSDFDRAMRSGSYRNSLRRLVGALVGRKSTDALMTQRLSFALQYDLSEGVYPARRVIGDRLGQPHDRQYAILVLTKLGKDKDQLLIRSMLDDVGVVASQRRVKNVRITTQVRDIALAALIYKSDGKFTDFGLPSVMRSPTTVLQTQTIGFPTESLREKNIAKWREANES